MSSRAPFPGPDRTTGDPAGAPAPPLRLGDRPSICLVMIAKDEAHVVREGLASALPWVADVVVVDTGSTDGTPNLVRSTLAAKGVPGHVLERPWRDFGSNRSEALALARELSSSDYLWMLDADDLVTGTPDLSGLTADAYHLRFGPDFEYERLQIFRRSLPWHYVGVLHEYPACDAPAPDLGRVGGDYWIVSRRLGSRSLDPKKYEKDAALLEAALAADPGNSRLAFYLAQSWRDSGRPDLALETYRRRVSMGGWEEEVFWSRYQAALCLEALGRPTDEVLREYEDCAAAHPTRAEALVRAAARARGEDRWEEAYRFASRAAALSPPGPGALFVEAATYAHQALDELGIAAFWSGRPEESFRACDALLRAATFPESERARLEGNRDFSIPFVLEECLRYDAGLVARLATRPRRPEAQVTLSITSCRRLGLFVDTVCSFLNACEDLERIDRFVCVDDGSPEADRAEMRRLFPFFEFVLRGPDEKGHARGMNRILETTTTPWLLHLEDDWLFLSRRPYVGAAIEVLEEEPGLGQLLFNRNYAETPEDREFPGGFRRRSARSDVPYVVHEHHPTGSPEFHRFQEVNRSLSNVWWPHFSLRPSLLRVSALRRVGRFAEGASHFELDYADRWVREGLRSAFLDGVHALHTGRLTRDRGERPNAYALNDEPQFGRPAAGPNPPPEAAAPSVPCRVKLLGNWASPRELCAAFERQAKEGRRWDGIAITDQDDADLFALFNLPGPEAGRFDPARTVVFAMEPDHAVARWGEWAAPDPRVFLQVRHHDRFPNCGEWHLGMTWGELRAAPVGPKTRGLSAVVSSRVADPGQLLRIGFLKFLEERGFPVDVWGWDNAHGFRGYRGSLPPRDKRDGLLPYRYTLAVENSAHPNYFTEKVLDALLAECLPFTWGCPNLADHIDPRAFVPLPLEDPEESLRMVTRTIAEETWSRRVDDIRREKRRILDEAHLFPTLARIARGDRLARALEIRVVNLDRRPDRLASFRREVEERAGSSFAARVVRFPAVDGRSLALTPELRHLFRGNDFGFRRGFVGCALSHLALWREAASSPAPAFLILEDDARLRRGFTGELVELCGALEERHPDFDAVLLGFFRWSEGAPSLDEPDHRTVRPVAFDGSRYLGGTFGYLLSRKGAARLVDLVERDGIQNGIDRFVHLKETELTILVAEPDLAAAHLVPPGSGLDSDIQNDPEPVPG